jgi:hypothetical protein
MNALQNDTAISLLQREDQDIKLLVADMSVGLTVAKAMKAPKIFQVKKKLGEETVIKILCVIIKSFCDSIKAKKTLDAADILECADMIAEKYTHDSIKDIVMAFKQAKAKGKVFYNSISIQAVFEIVTDYMDNKSSFIEKEVADMKSKVDGSTRTEANTIATQMDRDYENREKKTVSRELQQVQEKEKQLKSLENIVNQTIKRLE